MNWNEIWKYYKAGIWSSILSFIPLVQSDLMCVWCRRHSAFYWANMLMKHALLPCNMTVMLARDECGVEVAPVLCCLEMRYPTSLMSTVPCVLKPNGCFFFIQRVIYSSAAVWQRHFWNYRGWTNLRKWDGNTDKAEFWSYRICEEQKLSFPFWHKQKSPGGAMLDF